MQPAMIVVGSVAFDTLKTPKGLREKALGGSAVYISTVASYFTKVGLVGVAGKDFSDHHVAFLRGRGIDLTGFSVADGSTFHWSGSYGEDFGDATTHATDLNVFEAFNPTLPEIYRDVPFVFLGNIHPVLQLQVIEQVRSPKLIVMDTMNFWINDFLDDLKKVLKRVDILYLNLQEALQLSGEHKFAPAVAALLRMGPRRVVVKLGELGAMTATATDRFFTPAFPLLDITDPTGAGDSFGGGSVGYLAKTGDLSEAGFRMAMLHGAAMGSITVERFSLDAYLDLPAQCITERVTALQKMVTLS